MRWNHSLGNDRMEAHVISWGLTRRGTSGVSERRVSGPMRISAQGASKRDSDAFEPPTTPSPPTTPPYLHRVIIYNYGRMTGLFLRYARFASTYHFVIIRIPGTIAPSVVVTLGSLGFAGEAIRGNCEVWLFGKLLFGYSVNRKCGRIFVLRIIKGILIFKCLRYRERES